MRMVRVAVGRSGNELIGEVEASQRVHRRDFEGVMQSEIREQAQDTLSEHGLAHAWRAMEEHVMPAGSGYLAGPLRLHLTDQIRQVKTTLGMLAGRVPITSIGSTSGIGSPRKKATNWVIEARPITSIPATSLASPAAANAPSLG
jgi:hypothetical protein